ncbi:MFS family permease [Inquilinus ginsengisoli]|jgi:MFS family permease|uniref:MFS family permease n=1 Tax=Inquilinus ginsengisoli TaxID=363840 RepID=A0ABU1K001_9PROT|nr:MFS transporter [Inquilinus ginsengisoli]MDR6293624.1 MFS family permease [Inquilinus ginsengisoli]
MLSPLLAVAAILAGITIVSLGQGVFGTLVPIRLTEAGLSADRVGLVVSASAFGFLIGCLFVARVIRLVGHIRAFSAFAAASCLAGLALPWTVGLPGWFALRLAMGFCSAGLFMIAESWLNELTPRHLRGRILTSYVVVIMLALGAGQALLTVVDTSDILPFVLASAAFTLALIPVTLTRSRYPSVPHAIRPILRKAYRNSPVGAVGCVVVGLVAATLQGIAPIWGVQRGFSTAEIATLMAATQIGGLLCQWPLGWLSDRIDRRWVILGAALATIVAALGSIAAGQHTLALLIALFALWGGMAEAIYPLSVAHANDHAKPQDYVSLAGTLLILWSIGSSAGPLIATLAMDRFGPDALFVYVAVLVGAFAVFVLWRMARRGRVAAEEAEQFVGLAAAGSPAPAELDPRIRPEDEAAPGADDCEDVPPPW